LTHCCTQPRFLICSAIARGRIIALPAAEWKAAMRVQQSSHQGCVVLTLVGRLDSAAAPQVQDGQTTITGPVVDQAPPLPTTDSPTLT
jgi:hypothetical protein